MRVLIVEDDALIQVGLEQVVSKLEDFTVVGIAEDGYHGLQMAESLQPDLIIMDIGLPRLDGIMATQKIKEILPTVYVIILTSHTDEVEVIAALSSGADGYCIKGSTNNNLLAAFAAAKEGGTFLDAQIGEKVFQKLQLRPISSSAPQNNELAATAIQEANKIANSKLNLSPRELEVLQLMVEGKSNPEIANLLFISPNTVKTHVRGIMNKLSVDDRVQAAVLALRSGLVS
ncbi:MAG: response regulator transcription factor [Pseudanabaena sp. ELA607]|jgi:DNA-binding NarL/FixJ family response regulator